MHAETCPVCKGRGKLELEKDCHGCGGRGWVEVSDNETGKMDTVYIQNGNDQT